MANVLRAMEAENLFNVVVYDINGNDLYSNVLRTSTERKSLLQLDDLNDIEYACAGIYSESGEIVVNLDTAEARKQHRQKMNTVYSLIINRVHDDLVNTVKNKPKYPQIAWSALSELFEPSDTRSVYELHKKLKGLDQKDYDTYELLVNDIITINTRLTEQGEKLSDTSLISAMLDAYRKYPEFETQITLVEALPKPTFKQAVDHFKSIMPQGKAEANGKKGNGSSGSSSIKDDAATNQAVLSMFERKLNKFTRKITKRMNKQDNNNNGSNGQKSKRSKKELVKKPKTGQSIPFFNFDCNYCGRYGHRARDCPWKPKGDNNPDKGAHSSMNEVPDVDNVEPGEVEIEVKYGDKDIVDDTLEESEESGMMHNNNNSVVCDTDSCVTINNTNNLSSIRKYASVDSINVDVVDLDSMDVDRQVNVEHLSVNGSNKSVKPCLDSGATRHFFRDKKYFKSLRRIRPMEVAVGKQGVHYVCNYEGEVDIRVVDDNGKRRKVTLTNVVYAPKCNGNYVSVPVTDKLGFRHSLANGHWKMMRNNRTVLTASLNPNGMYYVNGVLVEQGSLSNLDSESKVESSGGDVELLTKEDIESMDDKLRHKLLNRLIGTNRKTLNNSLNEMSIEDRIMHIHRCLNHASVKKCIDTARSVHGMKIPYVPSQFKLDCPVCDVTKTKRAPVRKDDALKSKVDDRVHSDLKTMPALSMRNYKYFVVFVHEKSRYVNVRLLTSKNQVFEKAKQFIALAERSLGSKMIEFRTDGGGEYVSNDFKQWLSDSGITWTPSTPRTPEQNSIAERVIQTLTQRVRSMLVQAGLSVGHWCYAVEAAAYVLNRTRHKSIQSGKVPFELFTGRRPNLSNLFVFGTIGIAHVDKELRTRVGLSDTGEHVRVVGYDSRHGTYQCLTRTGKQIRRRIAKWLHDSFTFPQIGADAADGDSSAEDQKVVEVDVKEPNPNSGLESGSTLRRSARSNRGVGASLNACSEIIIESLNSLFPVRGQRDYDSFERLCVATDVSVHEIENVPRKYEEAITCDEKSRWIPSIEEELKSLVDNETWTLVKKPKNVNVVSSKWVFRKKINADRSIRYKSRLVARGFSQVAGVDYFRTYAPTLSLMSMHAIAFSAL